MSICSAVATYHFGNQRNGFMYRKHNTGPRDVAGSLVYSLLSMFHAPSVGPQATNNETKLNQEHMTTRGLILPTKVVLLPCNLLAAGEESYVSQIFTVLSILQQIR